jgi:hypothetical protein
MLSDSGTAAGAPLRHCRHRRHPLPSGGRPARARARRPAVELLLERGYSACEIDFEGGFWMDWKYAERLGESAREAGIALSVHARIPAFLGHRDRGGKYRMAVPKGRAWQSTRAAPRTP